ncbi:Trans-2-enoyl-CoA reductase, mitochondrial [Hypsibius exemplaris]|uniref:Enoyl-[acyl-carrier-protein] reductase, mitochondrial n=1 Tax=Hypsibius exemplaris TaxID=2072580 RepID=A0A9X6N9Q0_HYPEX|nr:Trans-2-enoyl-CoA reductase, mitochondrial [Hypsibius exemplaris]
MLRSTFRLAGKKCSQTFDLSPLRHAASTWTSTTAIKFKEYGDPAKVLYQTTEPLPATLDPGNVALRFLASPVNPNDINMVQGIYIVKPPLPAVCGNEGVAEVIGVGSAVKNVKIGDWVIPSINAFGTWQTHAVAPATDILKIEADLPLIQAATVAINPCSAFRMLYDYTSLEEGDVIVQNGANSAVGQAVIQIAAHNKWRTINIIRDRPNKAETVKQLADLGATHVITDADFKNRDVIKQLPLAHLGLNCVGGKAVSDMTKLLQDRATLVTYGGMSMQPMIIPTGAMIFKDLIFCGFWLGKWNMENSTEERIEMLNNVVRLMKEKVLRPPTIEPVLLKDFQTAVKRAQEGFTGAKQVLALDEESLAKIQEEVRAYAQA